jgi:hypothetical protein
MLELNSDGRLPYPSWSPQMDPEEAPHIGATPRHRRGFFPLSITATGQREGPLKGVTLEKVTRHFCERNRAWLGDVCASQSIRTGR